MALLLNANDSVNRSYTITKPSPNHQLSVNGVGNKTANLFNYKVATYGTWTNSNGTTISAGYAARSASLNAETVTVSCNGETKPYSYSIVWLDGNDTFISREHVGLASMIALPQTFTPPNNAVKYYMQVANGSDTSNPITESQLAGYKIMLNASSTPLDFEPYGYKIPISSGGVTTPMYLTEPLLKIGDYEDTLNSDGTVTRRISKIDLGTRTYSKTSSGNFYFSSALSNVRIITNAQKDNGLCTNFFEVEAQVYTSTPYSFCTCINSSAVACFNGTGFEGYTTEQFKEAMQGVIMYYVLATPTTETVTAPSIPTTEGANSITVDTTVQPSEFTATWTGWHDSSVKEYDGTDWQ